MALDDQDGKRLHFEIREAGGKFRGVMLQEGRAASGGRREVFAPGSVEWPSRGVAILDGHRGTELARAEPIRESNGELRIEAQATAAIRAAIRAGKRFMSVEFKPLSDRVTPGGVREILRAMVDAAALVADPEYDSTKAEIRARLGSGLRSTIPTGRRLDCKCHGSGSCEAVNIDAGAFEESIREAKTPGGRDILAVAGSYHSALGSVRRGTLTIESGDDGYRINLAALPDSTAGRDLVAAAENTPLLVRPIFDEMDEDFEGSESGNILQVRRARLKAVLIGATDMAEGCPEAESTEGVKSDRRTAWRRLWL